MAARRVGPSRARGAGVEFTLALERASRHRRRRRQLGPLRLLSTTTTKAKPVRQFPPSLARSLARVGRRARDNKRARPRFRPRSRAPATRDADKTEQGESAHRRIDCRRGVGRTRALVSDGRAAARFADRGKGPSEEGRRRERGRGISSDEVGGDRDRIPFPFSAEDRVARVCGVR